MKEYFGGIEAGGTHFNCIIANSPSEILAEKQIQTSTPEETITQVCNFFQTSVREMDIKLKAVGLGSFGPVDLRQDSATYGHILSTPKLAWQQYPILKNLQTRLACPVFLETDVDCAAIGEKTWGAGQSLSDMVYITIGTGIGVGIFCNGDLVHGLNHPEFGHIRIPHDHTQDPFAGSCPFHQDCFEGLASGPALETRWSTRGENLPPAHPAWKLEAHYIALAMNDLICALTPQRIILGGGVMQQKSLLPLIQREVFALLNNYIDVIPQFEVIADILVLPGLSGRSGTLGAIALARTKSLSIGE